MIGKWPLAKINDISERVAMGPFGSSIKVETFVSNGIPIISGQHLNGFKIDDKAGYNFITIEHADKLKHANVYRGDVIFTHAGNIGQVSFIPNNSLYQRYVISQRQFFLRPKQDKVLPEYLVAYFKSPEGQQKLLANTSSVGVPSISQPVSYLRNLEIPLPPLEEQRAIAHILCTLDDKIELNRRMNETLEQMARAIFKSWFVDFDPVRAKMSGRWKKGDSLPGLPAHLWDLFPDRLVPSELGDIPEGWPVESLSEIVEINPPRYLKSGQIAPYLDMANMPTTGHMPNNIILRPYSSGMRFINGDTLLARITPCLENGKTAFVNFLRSGEIGWGSTEYIVLRPKAPFPEQFTYFLARSSTFRDFAIQSMSGTSGRQRVSPEALSGFKLVRPSALIALEFGNLTSRLLDRAKACSDESRVIASLRASLLPKLIAGEICINSGIF
jgi:type I restriction enzyme S subunit